MLVAGIVYFMIGIGVGIAIWLQFRKDNPPMKVISVSIITGIMWPVTVGALVTINLLN